MRHTQRVCGKFEGQYIEFGNVYKLSNNRFSIVLFNVYCGTYNYLKDAIAVRDLFIILTREGTINDNTLHDFQLKYTLQPKLKFNKKNHINKKITAYSTYYYEMISHDMYGKVDLCRLFRHYRSVRLVGHS